MIHRCTRRTKNHHRFVDICQALETIYEFPHDAQNSPRVSLGPFRIRRRTQQLRIGSFPRFSTGDAPEIQHLGAPCPLVGRATTLSRAFQAKPWAGHSSAATAASLTFCAFSLVVTSNFPSCKTTTACGTPTTATPSRPGQCTRAPGESWV